MNNSITAVIPVKGNSTRLPNKNILPFAGTNLLEHKINQLKAVKGINEIICSSDSDEMLAIADKCGIKAIKRPKQFADESVPFGSLSGKGIYRTSLSPNSGYSFLV